MFTLTWLIWLSLYNGMYKQWLYKGTQGVHYIGKYFGGMWLHVVRLTKTPEKGEKQYSNKGYILDIFVLQGFKLESLEIQILEYTQHLSALFLMKPYIIFQHKVVWYSDATNNPSALWLYEALYIHGSDNKILHLKNLSG